MFVYYQPMKAIETTVTFRDERDEMSSLSSCEPYEKTQRNKKRKQKQQKTTMTPSTSSLFRDQDELIHLPKKRKTTSLLTKSNLELLQLHQQQQQKKQKIEEVAAAATAVAALNTPLSSSSSTSTNNESYLSHEFSLQFSSLVPLASPLPIALPTGPLPQPQTQPQQPHQQQQQQQSLYQFPLPLSVPLLPLMTPLPFYPMAYPAVFPTPPPPPIHEVPPFTNNNSNNNPPSYPLRDILHQYINLLNTGNLDLFQDFLQQNTVPSPSTTTTEAIGITNPAPSSAAASSSLIQIIRHWNSPPNLTTPSQLNSLGQATYQEYHGIHDILTYYSKFYELIPDGLFQLMIMKETIRQGMPVILGSIRFQGTLVVPLRNLSKVYRENPGNYKKEILELLNQQEIWKCLPEKDFENPLSSQKNSDLQENLILKFKEQKQQHQHQQHSEQKKLVDEENQGTNMKTSEVIPKEGKKLLYVPLTISDFSVFRSL